MAIDSLGIVSVEIVSMAIDSTATVSTATVSMVSYTSLSAAFTKFQFNVVMDQTQQELGYLKILGHFKLD